MTSDRYVVLNCPTLMGNRLCYSKEIKQCADCTNCIIKQVIEKCNYYQNKIGRTPQYRAGYVDATREILQLFDIEEVRE